MVTISLAPSDVESRRFGYRMARATIDGTVGPEDGPRLGQALQGWDIVILRASLADPLLAAHLASVPGHRAYTADHLMYWEWRGPDARPDGPRLPAGHRLVEATDPGPVVATLRASFAGYTNHYAANPLLDQSLALDGYQEWAERLMASGQTTTLVVESIDTAQVVAFGLLDWSESEPDIRLAAVHPEAQAAGWYRHVIVGLQREAATRGRLPLLISTQSSNTNVMRAWVRLGFVPFRTLATYHLVAERLLG